MNFHFILWTKYSYNVPEVEVAQYTPQRGGITPIMSTYSKPNDYFQSLQN
jgi:hypothetical protein